MANSESVVLTPFHNDQDALNSAEPSATLPRAYSSFAPSAAFDTGNLLLANLSRDEAARLHECSEEVTFAAGTELNASGLRNGLLFLESGLISLTLRVRAPLRIETGLVGREGVIGLDALLAEPRPTAALVQMRSSGRLLEREAAQTLRSDLPVLYRRLQAYISYRLLHAEVGTACNAVHSVQQRVARWLLMAAERAGTHLEARQDLVAEMLGVRRASVNAVATALRNAGVLRYTRGHLAILDMEQLRAAACSCHDTLSHAYARVCEPCH